MKKNLLFVCTGNTCRSPMAEAMFRRMLKEGGYNNEYTCSSAGVYAYEGDEASLEAVQAMKKLGIDISGHCAKTLDYNSIRDAYIIFTMTRDHKRMILDVFPETADKVFTLKEYAEYEKDDWDIPDPFGFDEETYSMCVEELNSVMLKILDKL